MSPYLAGDVGGTRVRLALARMEAGRPRLFHREEIDAADHDGLHRIVASYLERHGTKPSAAVVGVPGPVLGDTVRTTTRHWLVERPRLEELVGAPVALLNDLEAAAYGVPSLARSCTDTLQRGDEEAEGPLRTRAVVAAGTGLGEAGLIFAEGRWLALPSEGGHTEFGPRDEEETDLLFFLRKRFQHVSYERVVSGPGLVGLHEFYAERLGTGTAHGRDPHATASEISSGAAEGDCAACVAAAGRFSAVLGAEAGNLALKLMATGGVYLAGGIPPRMASALRRDLLLSAFRDKGRYASLMERIPVHVVSDGDLALRGAALVAARLGG